MRHVVHNDSTSTSLLDNKPKLRNLHATIVIRFMIYTISIGLPSMITFKQMLIPLPPILSDENKVDLIFYQGAGDTENTRHLYKVNCID